MATTVHKDNSATGHSSSSLNGILSNFPGAGALAAGKLLKTRLHRRSPVYPAICPPADQHLIGQGN
jgi:hypothetical protein